MLRKLEKHAKKIIRKSLKDNTLDYTVQFSLSSMDPGNIKYACQITSPAQGIQPITFIFDDYKTLEGALIEATKELNPTKVEIAFHENRISTYKNNIKQHEERMKVITDPNYDPEEDGIPTEEVELGKELKKAVDKKNETKSE